MMSVEKFFIQESIKYADLQEYLKEKFRRADFSRVELQRTTLGTRIIIWVGKPGLIVGRSGRKVEELAKEIREKFGIENPMVDVREVKEPMLDANIVATRVARAIERGINYKRVANYYLTRVMEAGAIGVQIKISGKVTGSDRARTQKFRAGYIKHTGDYAEKLVDTAQAVAETKPGIVGVEVKIMKEMPKEVEILGEASGESEGEGG